MRWFTAIAIALALCVALIDGQAKDAAKSPPKENEKLKLKSGGVKIPASKQTHPGPKAENDISNEPETTTTRPEVQAAVESVTEKIGLTSLKPARILVVLPMPFYSHTLNFMPIFKELARRGHKITMVSPYPQKEPLANWEDIVTEDVRQKIFANLPSKDLSERSQSLFANVMRLPTFGESMAKLYCDMQPLRDLYDSSREFDLVIVESQFVQEPLLAFGWKFKAPVISMFPTFITPEVAYYTGNPVFTTNYVPNTNSQASNSMNLFERFENTFLAVSKLIVYNSYYLPMMDGYMRKCFNAADVPYVADLLFNVSFTLMDTSPVLTYPYPRANNIREFLGINTKPDAPLSPEIQEIMDGADKDGVLLFTLGSTFQPSALKPHIREALMYAFSKIPQKVIMKWDADEPPEDLPPNVYTVKWVPQAGILRHKNCRAFFTHTGVHGVMEAMDHGVPLIAIPLFADQKFFAKWVEQSGVGKKLDHTTITPEIALAAVKEVLENPKYKENAVSVSIRMKDVPQPTLDETVYWVEHVLRTKGARHLRPGSLNLWWYQRFGLDVLAAALAIIILPLWLFSVAIKHLCAKCRGKTKATDTEKKRQKSKKDN